MRLGRTLILLLVATFTAVAVVVAPCVDAQQAYEGSMLLGPPYETNAIYSHKTSAGHMVVYSRRLKNALPSGVKAQSLSLGLDGTDYIDQHGLCLFSVKKPGPGFSNIGLLNSAVFREPQTEVQADIYGVPHTKTNSPTLNIKVVEENSANLPPVSDQYLPIASFGLPGTTTGLPKSATPAEIIGFDYHLVSSKGPIFFTVDTSFQVGSTTYYPSDILMLDQNDNIVIWAQHGSQGNQVDQGDKINALSVCLNPALGQDQNAIISLAGTPTTKVGGNTASAAHTFLFRLGTNTLTDWRSPAANGLFAAATPDIDSVTSIDPKRLVPGSQWTSAPSLTLGDPTYNPSPEDNFEVFGTPPWLWNSIKGTVIIEWDFSLTPLGSGFFTPAPPLNPGDEQSVSIFFLQDGRPKAHYAKVRVNGASNPSPGLEILPSQNWPFVDFNILGFNQIPIPLTEWRTKYNGQYAYSLAPWGGSPEPDLLFLDSFNTNLPVQMEVQGNSGGFSTQTYAIGNMVWPEGLIDPPTDLAIRFLDETTVEISWTPNPLATDTKLTIFDGSQNPLEILATSPHVVTVAPNGFHRVRLIAENVLGDRSLPLEGSFFAGIEQRIESIRTIPSPGFLLPFLPGDLALERSTASLVAVPRDGVGNDFWTVMTLDHDGPANPQPYNLPDLDIVTGVASYLESYVDPGQSPAVRNRLLFIGWLAGVPRLVVTEAEEPFTVVSDHDLQFPAGPFPTELGALAYLVENDELLVVADGQLYAFGLPAPGSATSGYRVETLRFMNVGSVSARDIDSFEVTVAEDGSSNFVNLLTLDSNHQVVGAMEMTEAFGAHGVVHAHDPLPAVYFSMDSNIQVSEMPLRVGPSQSHPFDVQGMPFDLNNDGIALDAADIDMFQDFYALYLAVGETAAIIILESEADSLAGWDVDGSIPSFPGDGVITVDDFWAIYFAILGPTPPSLCVPVNIAWQNETPNPGCP